MLALGLLALWGGTASAAGTGYGSGGTTPPTAPAGFTTIVVNQTVSPTGGTVKASFDGQQITVTIPAGDFSTPVQVTVLAPSSPPSGAVTAFDLSFAVNGKAVSGALAKPVTFAIQNSSIKAGDVVEVWNGTAWVRYPDATVANGTVTITITSDPAFSVVTSNVPGATTGTTGVPVDGIVLVAGGLVLIGVGGLLLVRRRRPSVGA